jgi:hypothetical protein
VSKILVKIPNMNFHENSFEGCRSVSFGSTDRQIDMTKSLVCLCLRNYFAKTPTITNYLLTL